MYWGKSIEGLGGKSIAHQTFKCTNMMADIIFILSLFSISFKTEFFIIITRTFPPHNPHLIPYIIIEKSACFCQKEGTNFLLHLI